MLTHFSNLAKAMQTSYISGVNFKTIIKIDAFLLEKVSNLNYLLGFWIND
jgi:hypothetical protein